MANTTVIVGWGIAGANIAWQLYKRGEHFVVHNHQQENATTVAAGLINPVVFRRLTKSWNADTLLPFAANTYNDIEAQLNAELTSNFPIRRIFASIEEQNNWESIYGDGRHDAYMGAAENYQHDFVKVPFLSGTINAIGHLKTESFLNSLQTFFTEKGIEFKDEFDYTITDDFNYIFCEGRFLVQNPFFNYLPLRQTHGEVITIHAPDLKLNEILNKNMFLLPLGNDLYKVGATYNWELKKPITTESGKQELLEKIDSFIMADYTVVNHEAGIRPTVQDRRPLIGRHPDKPNLFVFNGMGTKGVMIAPYYAHQLLAFIDKKSPLDEEVNIERFSKHYNV